MIEELEHSKHINEIESDLLEAIQSALAELNYYPSNMIDGISGPLTQAALKEFKNDFWLAYPLIVGNSTINKLNEVTHKEPQPPNYNPENKDEAIKAIVSEAIKKMSKEQVAYVLATADHETNNTFKPVIEAYWLSETWRRLNLRYYPYYGRGIVQITWLVNYRKYANILNIDLVNNPDLALEPNISLFILIHGMIHGSFTGFKISDFINNQKIDFYHSRKVINGLDKASHIANLARDYLNSEYLNN